MDIVSFLAARGAEQRRLHDQAGQLCDTVFGNRVFVRGVVELSSFCRQNCGYCAMRRDNHALRRYRLAFEDLAQRIIHERPKIITDIDLQAGEDPVAVRQVVLPLVREIRRRTPLGITLCLGTLGADDYDALREAGADVYVLKIESGNADHYREIEAPGSLSQRVAAVHELAARGWNVSSGFIVGLPGQDLAQIVETFKLLQQLPLAGCSVSPFIAGVQTPYADQPNASLELTLNCLALLRRLNPAWVIPAVSALRSVGRNGYERALRAGANLATINMTPDDFRAQYPIYKRDRFIMDEERVLEAIDRAGSQVSTVGVSEYFRVGNGRPAAPARAAVVA